MRSDLAHMPMHCVVCQTVIPEERDKRKATTCSPECLVKRKQALRNRMDAKRCRYCQRPSNPAERGQFNRWRKQQGQTAAIENIRRLLDQVGDVQHGLAVDKKSILKLLDTLQEAPQDYSVDPDEKVEEEAADDDAA